MLICLLLFSAQGMALLLLADHDVGRTFPHWARIDTGYGMHM
jgi:hypothetical protein